MRIEELILEGFKSYPVRTQITGWDPSFNAITGLNGSGKSNILDAICFVLGLTNMATMRASNQQDLIYKRGQAGVTKASVTIVFDNSDRSKSPVGQENNKQVTVTRQIALPMTSKYLLNGRKSSQEGIQTLFQSVQLNINNPNFVIMQGRITKVLNMRPQDILGMVEEAAGTRMFEEKKEKAKRTMAKKEKRVNEIEATLKEEIEPKLHKLGEEKREYLEYQKACDELERTARLLRAWEWTEAREKGSAKKEEIEEKQTDIQQVKETQKKAKKAIETAEASFKQVSQKRDAEMKKGGKLSKLEQEESELDKELVKVRTQVDIKRSTIAAEEGKVAAAKTDITQLEASIVKKRKNVAAIVAKYEKVNVEHNEKKAQLASDEELLQTLQTGLTSGSTATGGGYMGQIADATAKQTKAKADEEQNRRQLQRSEQDLQNLETKWKTVEREAGDGKKKVEAQRKAVDQLRARVDTFGWSEDKEQELVGNLNTLKQQVRHYTEKRDNQKQNLGGLNFDYPSPYPNFDRKKVKGRLGSLVSLNRDNYNKATALEITAGGRLYNVVVEDEKVGKDLLAGQLRQRVTLIPLNKINGQKLPPQKLVAAQKLAPGKVSLALDLVGSSREVANAMTYVFGNTLVCDDAATAKAVTFAKDVRTRSVTLDGDIYDPSGTLSGGAAPTSNGILVKVQDLIQAEEKLAAAEAALDSAERDSERSRQKRSQWKAAFDELQLKEHEVNLLEQQTDGSNASMLEAQVEELKQTIADLKAAIKSAKERQVAAEDEIERLKNDMKEFKNNKEGKTEQLKQSISTQKAAIQKHAVIVKTQQKDSQTAGLELEGLDKDLIKLREALVDAEAGVVEVTEEALKMAEKEATVQKNHETAKRKLQEERAALSRFDDELKALEKTIKDKKTFVEEQDEQLEKLEAEIANLKKEITAANNLVAHLQKQNSWIEEDQHLFGEKGTQYDFAAAGTIDQIRIKASELEKSTTKKKKSVNPKAMATIGEYQNKGKHSREQLAQVMEDRAKIDETLENLDQQKREALEKTWKKVNADFGGIFGELLPGNFAKLQPPEGQDLMDGLEVKVRLGSVWKQSLTELSGGQRSLIALSLIMALLQFKPAPMYILDEIDAALDLSHTQHIGQLFRTRFKGSQFIVVSLKEGLFTNANVLFRARFRDGTSIVDRTVTRTASTLYDNNNAENENDESRRARRGQRSN